MVTQHKIEYHHLAQIQLNAAIDHFEKENLSGFICAITLAHAARGILTGGKQDSFFSKMKTIIATRPEVKDIFENLTPKKREEEVGGRLHTIPNALKHCRPENLENGFDPRLEAYNAIFFALEDYAQCTGTLTQIMMNFRDKWLSRGEEVASGAREPNSSTDTLS